jgi:hypothetical protein
MRVPKGWGPARRDDAGEAQGFDPADRRIHLIATSEDRTPQGRGSVLGVRLRAELVGSKICQAAGLTARGRAPVLALCRKLLAAGHDPGLPVDVYRGDTLAFIIRTIGEGAWLDVADDRHGRPRLRGRRDRGDGAGSPVEEIDGAPKGRHGPAKRTEGGGP